MQAVQPPLDCPLGLGRFAKIARDLLVTLSILESSLSKLRRTAGAQADKTAKSLVRHFQHATFGVSGGNMGEIESKAIRAHERQARGLRGIRILRL